MSDQGESADVPNAPRAVDCMLYVAIPRVDSARRSMLVQRCMRKHVSVILKSISSSPWPNPPAKEHMIQMKMLEKLRPGFSGSGNCICVVRRM